MDVEEFEGRLSSVRFISHLMIKRAPDLYVLTLF
jgi:hypothetical protein